MLLQDYENTYYPITLPLRQPNSGDPGILFESWKTLSVFLMQIMALLVYSHLVIHRSFVLLLEILNENEFGEDAEKEYDENTINPASELGLLVRIGLVTYF